MKRFILIVLTAAMVLPVHGQNPSRAERRRNELQANPYGSHLEPTTGRLPNWAARDIIRMGEIGRKWMGETGQRHYLSPPKPNHPALHKTIHPDDAAAAACDMFSGDTASSIFQLCWHVNSSDTIERKRTKSLKILKAGAEKAMRLSWAKNVLGIHLIFLRNTIEHAQLYGVKTIFSS